MLKLLPFICVMLCWLLPCYAQDETVTGSLQELLQTDLADTSRVEVLCGLARLSMSQAPEKGLEYAQEALEISQKAEYQLGIANSYYAMGIYYSMYQDYARALEYRLAALHISESMNYREEIVDFSLGIGHLYLSMGNHEMMLTYSLKALRHKEAVKSQHHLADLLSSVGIGYMHQGNYDLAMSYIIQSQQLCRKLDYKAGMASNYKSIARIHQQKGEHDKAIEFHLLALRELEATRDEYAIIPTMRSIAYAYQQRGNYHEALKHYQQALARARKLRLQLETQIIYQGLSETYAHLNDFSQAYCYQLQFNAVKDSIFNGENSRKIAEMQMRYETDQKQAQIELLHKSKLLQQEAYDKQQLMLYSSVGASVLIMLLATVLFKSNRQNRRNNMELTARNAQIMAQKQEIELKNTVLMQQQREIASHLEEIRHQKTQLQHVLVQMEQQNEQLQNSELELLKLNSLKNKYFSILSHDLRNSFASLKAYLPLLRMHIKGIDTAEIVDLLDEFKNNIYSVNNLLDNVLLWSLSQMNMMPVEEKKLFLHDIAAANLRLFETSAQAGRITLFNDTPGDQLVFVDENMLNSIFRNLLSNAIKFTPQGGSIGISSELKGQDVEIVVSDSGEGISEEDQYKLFNLRTNSTTTKAARGTGLGLVLCREFVERSGGSIRVESARGEGTRFIFSLPSA